MGPLSTSTSAACLGKQGSLALRRHDDARHEFQLGDRCHEPEEDKRLVERCVHVVRSPRPAGMHRGIGSQNVVVDCEMLVAELLDLPDIGPDRVRVGGQLGLGMSSGQRRRVSIARALASEPRLLLLDEPFTGLDAPVRDRLRRLQIEANLSTVIVTHDPEEAALLADEVIILSDGQILQSGTRESVFHTPASPEIARLLGIANANRGLVLGPGLLNSRGAVMRAPTGELSEGAQVIWSVRPERVSPDPRGQYEARLLDEVDLGAVRELTISLNGQLELLVRTDVRARLRIGQQLTVEVPAEDINVWPAVADPLERGGRSDRAVGQPRRIADSRD
jgi:ABC transporter/TOBE domain